MSEQNKTKIRIELDKTIQPKQFEPIKIIVDIEESFYWTDEKDRDEKMKTYVKRLVEDFVNTFNYSVKRIGEEDRCIGRVLTSGDTPAKGKETISSDDEFTFD